MTGLALITGASSGIGRALAHEHASAGGDVAIAARRVAELEGLKAELEGRYGVSAHVFAIDLAAEHGARALYEQVTATGLEISILINNAGFGGHGRVIEREAADDLRMIDLNVKALVELCQLCAGDMVARGSGKILNVGSTAGFLPGPQQATYFATKAFVNSFSQALDHEVRPKGVTCTLLAPGYVETEFATVSDMKGAAMVKAGGATAESVAKIGYQAMLDGKLVVINDRRLGFALNWITPLMPRRWVLNLADRSQSK